MATFLHVHVRHLPRLMYMMKLLEDFYRRALDVTESCKISHLAEELRFETPKLISQGKIDLFYKVDFKNWKLEKWDENKTSDCVTNSKEHENHGEKSFGKISIYLTPETHQISDHQRLTQKHKIDITEYLEKDIYEYVESVNKQLETHKDSGTKDKVILTGEAILNENPNREKKNVEPFLHDVDRARLESVPGVVGYGVEKNGTCVLAKCTLEQDKVELQNRIFAAFKKEPTIIWVDDFRPYTRPGGRLIPGRFEDTGDKFGSLGVFGTTECGKFVVTTAGHIFEHEQETAYTVKKSDEVNETGKELIGTCMVHLNEYPSDFALVELEGTIAKNCSKTICHPDYDDPLEVKLYKQGPGELNGKIVQTLQTDINLVTSYSDGIVKTDPFFFSAYPDKPGYIAITSKDPQYPFALPGHSGAPVIRIEFENGVPVAKVVATFILGPSSDSNNCAGKKGHVEDCFISWRLDESFNQTKKEKQVTVNIDTTATE